MAKKPYNFRLPEEISDQVESYLSRTGIGPTQFFTEAVIEKLSGNSQEQVLQEMESLRQELKQDISENGENLAKLATILQSVFSGSQKSEKSEVPDLQKKAREMLARIEGGGGS